MVNKVKNFFIKPNELFRTYKERPTWLTKTLLIGVITAIYSLVVSYLGKDETIRIAIEKMPNATPEQIDMTKKIYEAMFHPLAMLGIGAFSMVSAFVVILIVSLIYFAAIKLFDGKGKFSKALAVYTLAYIPVIIGMVLKGSYMYITKSLIFLDLQPSYSSAIFSHLDIFVLWQSVLLVFGISTAFEMSEKKSAVLVILMWALSVLLSVGYIFITGLFS